MEAIWALGVMDKHSEWFLFLRLHHQMVSIGPWVNNVSYEVEGQVLVHRQRPLPIDNLQIPIERMTWYDFDLCVNH